MRKFKLNTNKLVVGYNESLIRPHVGHDSCIIRSVNFTKDTDLKLEKLRAKYKISRSAIIRILIDAIDV